jgi:hypothetical protein
MYFEHTCKLRVVFALKILLFSVSHRKYLFGIFDTNDDHSIYMLVSESDHEDLSEILEKVFPNAPEKMKLFLMSQHEALSAKSPQARRWNKDVISLCLSLIICGTIQFI